MSKSPYQKSLYYKYLIPLVLTMSIALLLGGLLISVLVYNQIIKVEATIKDQAKKEFVKDVSFKHRIYTNKITTDISRKFLDIDSKLYKLSNSVNVRQMKLNYVKKEADSLLHKDSNILEFKIVNNDARADYAHCDPDKLYSNDLGILKPQDLFYGENKLHISKTFYDIESGERYNYLARPILDYYGKVNSYVMVRYSLDFINDSIQSQDVKELGNFYVLDQNNILVAQSSGELILNKFNKLSGKEQMLIANQKSGSIWEDKLLSFYKSNMGWTFAMETPNSLAIKEVNERVALLKSSFNNAIYKILLLIALGLLFISFLTTAVGIKVAKSVTRPVVDLITGVRKIADGDLNVRLAAKSDDEIGELTIAFNEMAKALKDYQEKIDENTSTISKQAEALGESNEELKNYAHTVSHDLKTPLRNITGYVGLIERRYGDRLDAEGKEYFTYIKNGTGRMNRTIEDLLKYSKLEQNIRKEDFTEVDLNVIVNNVKEDLKPLIEENEARLIYTSLPKIKGHPTLLYSLFQNLIANSIKYRREIAPYIKISHKMMNSKHLLVIEDNGTGIEDKFLEEIFKPFKRLVSKSSVEGSGIGLATVKKIVGFHQGAIKVRSIVGNGTTFEIYFPSEFTFQDPQLKEKTSKVSIPEELKESIEYVQENGNGTIHKNGELSKTKLIT